jgi:hypothetical protein
MPCQELVELNSEQVYRILSMATSARYLKSRPMCDTTPFIFEVQLDFARTMNKITIEKMLEKPSCELRDIIPANLTLPPPKPEVQVPYFGRI